LVELDGIWLGMTKSEMYDGIRFEHKEILLRLNKSKKDVQGLGFSHKETSQLAQSHYNLTFIY